MAISVKLPNETKALGYDKSVIQLGSVVQNIESHWIGRVVAWESINGDTMVKCQHEGYDGHLEADDVQWFDPSDMNTVKRCLEWSRLWNAMKDNPDSWIETTEAMYDEQLGCMPPAAQRGGAFLVGEAARHNSEGHAVFACFRQSAGRFHAKYLTRKQFN